MSEEPISEPDSLAQSTSDLQVLPPPRHDELDRLLFHIPLEDFGQRLQRAAQAVFPNDTESRYKNVHVLLLCWEDGDPRLPVERELAELEDVFQNYYHFETETWRIPSKTAHRALNRKITDFVELEDDSRDCLKIVYYGGHGFLSPGRQLMWSNLPSRDEPLYQSVKWHAIQATLEDADSDVLLLLDCCAAGTASTDNGRGVTELLGACAFNVTANGVGEFSFTTALSKELRAFSKVPSFTVGRLFNNLLRRTQMTLSHMTLQKAPIHVVLTQDEKLPRSIQLSPLPLRLEESQSSLAVAKTDSDSGVRGSPFSKASDDDSPFSPESSRSSMTSLSLNSNKMYPRIALSVQLPDDVRPDQLSEDLFRDWLRMIPVVAKNVKVEAGWASFSTLLIVSVPLLIWRYIEEHPAVRMVGIIQSPNVLAPKIIHEKKDLPSLMDTEGGVNENFKAGMTIVKRWFGELGKRNQREVLFKLHDARVAKQFFSHQFNHDMDEISEVDSNDWGSDSESSEDEREPFRVRSERRRPRSRTRSSAGYSESVPDPEMAMVRFEAQSDECRPKSTYSGRDSAYGSTTSGSRSSRVRRRQTESSSPSSSSTDEERPSDLHSRSRRGDAYLGGSRAEVAALGRGHFESTDGQKDDQTVGERGGIILGGKSEGPDPRSQHIRTSSYCLDPRRLPQRPPSPPQSRPGSLTSEIALPVARPWSGQVPPPFRPSRANEAQPPDWNHTTTSSMQSPPSNVTTSSPSAPPSHTAADSSTYLFPAYSDRLKERSGTAAPLKARDILALRTAIRDRLESQSSPSADSQNGRDNEGHKEASFSADNDTRTSLANSHSSLIISAGKKQNEGDTVGGRQTKRDGRSPELSQSEIPQEQEIVSRESATNHIRVVSPPREKTEDKAVKGILRQPREKFPEDPLPIREGVAPLKDAKKDGAVPPDARWTKISRKLVNPEALEAGKERYEVREDFVIVLRVLSKDEVQAYAVATQQIREAKEESEEREAAERRRKARRERRERHKREPDGSLRHEIHRRTSREDGSSSESHLEVQDVHEEGKKEGSGERRRRGDRKSTTTETKHGDEITRPTRALSRTRSPDSTYSSLNQDSRPSRS